MKFTPFVLLSLCSVVSANTLDERIDKLEKQMKDVRMRSLYGNYGAKTASAIPNLDRFGPFLSMEMLFWKPFVGGTEFAYFDDSFPVAAPFDSKIVQFNFDWQFGLRASAGYQFCDPDWALFAEYTRVKFHQVKHASHPTYGLSASGLPGVTNETSAEAKWALSFNVFDVDLARAYFLRSRFSVSPRMGVRTAWLRGRDQAEYFNASNNQSALIKFINSTTGAGLLFGSNMSWHWSSQWSLSSNIIASFVYGKMKVHAKSMNFHFSPTIPLDISADTYKMLPNMSLDTALTWEMAWRVVRLSLALGYELQYWWRQNQRLHLDTETTYSWVRYAEDIGFHGIKFKAALDF